MTQSIPKPELPRPRRRSSISQAAIASREEAHPPADDSTTSSTSPAEAAADELEGPLIGSSGSSSINIDPLKPGGHAAHSRGDGPTTTTRPRKRAASSVGSVTSRAEVAKKRPGGSADILLSIPEELKERMVNTITWSQPHTGIAHQQKFIRKAITDLCERYERDFNRGDAFPPRAVLDPD